MPFVALKSKDGSEKVTPSEVEKGVNVFCVDCNARMRVWRKHTDKNGVFKPRHFQRPSDGDGAKSHEGCGGEGDEHRRCKAIAVSTLSEFYPNGDVLAEKEFDLHGAFKMDTRDGDVALTFASNHDKLGAGLVVEVQDKNKSKDVLDTTESYLSHGYSVCWLSTDEFGKHSLKYSENEFKNLLENNHPDSKTVHSGVLNEDGTVPNKDSYPLVAPTWPWAVKVAKEQQPHPRTGWDCNAVTTNNRRHVVVQGDGEYNNQILAVGTTTPSTRVSMPKQFYKNCARRWFRDTSWSDLFTEYEWDPGRIRDEWGDECSIDEMEVKIPLNKWCSQNRVVLAIGEKVSVPGDLDVLWSRGRTHLKNGLLCVVLPVGNAPKSYRQKYHVVRDGTQEPTAIDILYYITPNDVYWEETPWHAKFSGTLELPIEDANDGEPTKPTASPPFAEWLRSGEDRQGIIPILKKAHVNGEHDIDESRKDRNIARERVKGIIEHNTGGDESSTVSGRAVRTVGSHSNVPNTLIRWAIGQLHADGEIEEPEPDRYRLSHSTRRQ